MEERSPVDGDCNPSLASVRFPLALANRAKIYKALGDVVRLKVLHLVSEREVCVCDLMQALGMPQGTLSHHLSVLQQAGLVTARTQGRWNYYQATWLAAEASSIDERSANAAG